jgi:hypothetical protein
MIQRKSTKFKIPLHRVLSEVDNLFIAFVFTRPISYVTIKLQRISLNLTTKNIEYLQGILTFMIKGVGLTEDK